VSEPIVPQPTAPPTQPTALDNALTGTEITLDLLAGFGGAINPAVPAIAALLARLERIAAKSIHAHEAITGQPLDLTRLHRIEPLP
jgi:hypothetical protein